MEPFAILRPILMAARFVIDRFGWKLVIGGWVASALAVVVYEVAT